MRVIKRPSSIWLAWAGMVLSTALTCLTLTRPELVRSWTTPAPIVALNETVRLDEAKIGSVYTIQFSIHNRSDGNVRIVGGHDFGRCGPYGCRLIEGLPMDVPAHSTVEVETKYQPTAIGSAENELILYTDHPASPEIHLFLLARVDAE